MQDEREDPTFLFLWILSRLSPSQQQRVTSLQGALEPRILLTVLADVLPLLRGEPGLATAVGDDEALITIYVNACRRAGMTNLFDPHSHPSLRANEPGGIPDADRGASVTAVLRNVSELRALFEARQEYLMDASGASENLVRGNTTNESSTVRLTYHEHIALFTGVLNAAVTNAGRERLWLWLLAHEPSCIAAAHVLKSQASAANRRVDEARRALLS